MKSKVTHKHLITTLITLILILLILFTFSVYNDMNGDTKDYMAEEIIETESDIPGEDLETPSVEGDIEIETYEEAIITINGLRFEPDTITIVPGTKVTWINTDQVAHKVVAYDRLFYGSRMETGDSYSFTFTQEGTHRYFDAVFPKIGRGTIIVKEEPLPITGAAISQLKREEANGKLAMIILLFIIMIFSLSKGIHKYYS